MTESAFRKKQHVRDFYGESNGSATFFYLEVQDT